MLIKLSIILLVFLIGKYYADIDYIEDNDHDFVYQERNCDKFRRELDLRDRQIYQLKRRLESDRGRSDQWQDVGRNPNTALISNYDSQQYLYPHEIDEVIIDLH